MGGGLGHGFFTNTLGGGKPNYPGNNASKPPGQGFQWRGKGNPGSGKGSWYNPQTGEKWFPDLNHNYPVGPHWDYTNPNGDSFRVFPDGRVEPK